MRLQGPRARRRQRDPLIGGVRTVSDRDGFLTRPSGARPARIAIDFVRRRAARFGLDSSDLAALELTRRYTSESGATHLQWAQTYRGIPAFDNGLRANVSADGRLINVGGAPRPDLAVASIEPRLGPDDAVRAAARGVSAGVALGPADPSRGPERTTAFGQGHRAGLVLFGDTDGVRLAWRVLLRVDSQHVYDAVIDAGSGETLYRRNLVLHATGLAFDNYPGAPVGGTQTAKLFPEAGADPWITDPDRLFGHNAHVYSDERDAIDGFPPDPSPTGADEIPPLAPGAWGYVQDARSPSSPWAGLPTRPGLLLGQLRPRSTQLQLARQPRAGRHPALLLRESLPRPPARRRRHRLRRGVRQLRGGRPRSGPGGRRSDDRPRRFRRLPRLQLHQQRERDSSA